MKRLILIAVLLASLMIPLASAGVIDPPPLPDAEGTNHLYGSVLIDQEPAPVGTIISLRVGDVERSAPSGDGSYSIKFKLPDSVAEGSKIDIYVSDVYVASVTYTKGFSIEKNLDVGMECEALWNCTPIADWSTCVNNFKTRELKCVDSASCAASYNKTETASCGSGGGGGGGGSGGGDTKRISIGGGASSLNISLPEAKNETLNETVVAPAPKPAKAGSWITGAFAGLKSMSPTQWGIISIGAVIGVLAVLCLYVYKKY